MWLTLLPTILALVLSSPAVADSRSRSVHSTNSRLCSRLPPAINKMRQGYDITTLDLLPRSAGGPDGTKRAAIDFTCTEQKQWHSSYDGQLYDFPDQLASMTTIPRGILTYDSYLWKSYHDVKKTWSEKVGLSGSLLGGMFGGSKSKQRMLHTINAMENYVEDISSFVSGSRAEFQPPWLLELNAGSQAFIDRFLPTNYSANPAAYDIFISYYGTHFFEQAQFGGILKMTMETAKSYVSSEGDVSTQLNAEASFKNWLSVMGASSSSTDTIDKKFTDATYISKKYYGGVGNLLGDSFYANWVPTIAGNREQTPRRLQKGCRNGLCCQDPQKPSLARRDEAIT